MAYVHCDACGAGFHGNVRSCPECGAPAKRSHGRRRMFARASSQIVREDVELEVRAALYGRRSGAVERSGR